MLYCICRKPLDERATVTCHHCSELYHLECVSLCSPPRIYTCAACKPVAEELSTSPLVDNER